MATAVDFDFLKYREDFPVLKQLVYNKPLVYLDNAATSQKPEQVIGALSEYYRTYNANIHRGVHFLSQKASTVFDEARVKLASFINAPSSRNIVFVRGATEGINLVSSCFANDFLKAGDEIILTVMEHHSNIVPWQLAAQRTGAVIRVIPMTDEGELEINKLDELITNRTRLISMVHTSNSLGTINPVERVIALARQAGIPVLIDAAQAVVHDQLDVSRLDADFVVFSAHKMLGPTGIGCLYAKEEWLLKMNPWQGGGDMIHSVAFEGSTWNEIPYKFEAGTPDISGVIAWSSAIDYLMNLDREAARLHEERLTERLTANLNTIRGVRLIGTAARKISVVSFVIEGINALDAGMYLDTQGIAVRTGHHCTEPLMRRLGINGTIRASMMFYNTPDEMDYFAEKVVKAVHFLQPQKV